MSDDGNGDDDDGGSFLSRSRSLFYSIDGRIVYACIPLNTSLFRNRFKKKHRFH